MAASIVAAADDDKRGAQSASPFVAHGSREYEDVARAIATSPSLARAARRRLDVARRSEPRARGRPSTGARHEDAASRGGCSLFDLSLVARWLEHVVFLQSTELALVADATAAGPLLLQGSAPSRNTGRSYHHGIAAP